MQRKVATIQTKVVTTQTKIALTQIKNSNNADSYSINIDNNNIDDFSKPERAFQTGEVTHHIPFLAVDSLERDELGLRLGGDTLV